MPKARGMIVVDTIGPHLDIMIATANERVVRRMEQEAKGVEEYAKKNAPWSDRTGTAREGLHTEVYTEGGDVVLELAHQVDYGVWLELIQNGAFAIIMPTLEVMGARVVQRAGGELISIEEVF